MKTLSHSYLIAKRYGILAVVFIALRSADASSPGTITSFAGGGPDHAPATAANVDQPVNAAVDSSGNFYFVTQYGTEHRVFKVSSTGTLTVVAGNGFAGFSGDGQLATLAELNNPRAIALDSSKNIYIADFSNCAIRKVSASTGIISTVAGTAKSCGYSGDAGPAVSAKLNGPTGIAVDGSGNLYVSDYYNQRIRKVSSGGTITTVAGNGTAGFSGDGSAAVSAELYYPQGVAVDGAGNVYIADSSNYRIRKVSSGKISTVAGNGTRGYTGDGGSATNAEIGYVYGISADSSGRVYIADTQNCVIRQVGTSGTITTVAGDNRCGYTGDGGSATSAELNQPYGVAVDSSSHIYIADLYNLRIRKATVGGNISTVAGNGTYTYLGEGIPAEGSSLNNPFGVSTDNSGNVYIADRDNCLVRKVNTSGTISTFAGKAGNCVYSGDGSAATSAGLRYPTKVVADSSGNIYIADEFSCAIRKVAASTGIISTVAGTGVCGYTSDGGLATSAKLNYPMGVAVDGSNNLYIADTYNYRVRKVSASTGNISTIAGNGTAGFGGDGYSGTAAKLYYPTDVALDSAGNIFIADQSNNRVRVLNRSGIINTFAGNGATGFQGDGDYATETSLYNPTQVAVDAAGDVLICDDYNNRIRLVNTSGIIYTLAGTGTYGFFGDGGNAAGAMLANPVGVGVDKSGNIYIGDSRNNRIRQISALPNLTSSVYNITFPEQTLKTASQPQGLLLRAVGSVDITNISISGDFFEADDCPTTLNSASSCDVEVTFDPTNTGTRTGTLTVYTNSVFNPKLTISLSGVGGGLRYTPSSIDFGNQAIGKKSSSQSVVFTNSSTSSITFSSVSTTRTTFAVASNACTGRTCRRRIVYSLSDVYTCCHRCCDGYPRCERLGRHQSPIDLATWNWPVTHALYSAVPVKSKVIGAAAIYSRVQASNAAPSRRSPCFSIR